MANKNITLIINHFEEEHLGKDVFLVPYYLGKIYNLDVRIVYPKTKTNMSFPEKIRGVTLCPLRNVFSKKPHSGPRIIKELVYLLYILYNAKKIDILMRFHTVEETVLIGFFYKHINPNGILYIKADGNLHELNNNFTIKSLKMPAKLIRRYFFSSFAKKTNLITVETKQVFRNIPDTQKTLGVSIKQKTHLLSNGFDNEQFVNFNIKIRKFEEKENILIFVGRIGSHQKNTELLLDALRNLYLKNWKFVLIGPIEKEEYNFQKIIDDFFYQNPHLKEKIIFTGPIYDKKELWEWYNKAKIFVLPSRHESFGIVLTEALIFRNYIVSTDVGGSGEIIDLGYGELIPQENVSFLHNTLQRLINENRLEYHYEKVDWENIDISWETNIRRIFDDFF